MQALTGGTGSEYAEEIEKARKEAIENLKNEARKVGVNRSYLPRLRNCGNPRVIIFVTAYGKAVKMKK